MELLDFLLKVGLAATAMIVLWTIVVGSAAHTMQKRSRVNDVEQKIATNHLIPLTVEVADNQFLCYNAKNWDFVCQGQTLAEIQQRFKLRYPDKSATIINGDDPAVSVLRHQLKEQRENSSGIRSPS